MRIYSVSVCIDWNASGECLRETWQVCVCVCVYVCVCIYIYTRIYPMCAVCICECVCVCVYVYVRICGVSVCMDCNANGECLGETSQLCVCVRV